MKKQMIYTIISIIIVAIVIALISLKLCQSKANPTEQQIVKQKFGPDISDLKEYRILELGTIFEEIIRALKDDICRNKERISNFQEDVVLTYNDIKDKILPGIFQGKEQVLRNYKDLQTLASESGIMEKNIYEIVIAINDYKHDDDMYGVLLKNFKPDLDLETMKFTLFSAFILGESRLLVSFSFGDKGQINGIVIATSMNFDDKYKELLKQ